MMLVVRYMIAQCILLCREWPCSHSLPFPLHMYTVSDMSGTRYLMRLWTSRALVPLAVCLSLAYVAKRWGGFHVPPLIIATLSVLGGYCLSLYLQNYMKKRTADAAGWTLAPSVPGRSLFRILRLAEAVRKGYPGVSFSL